MAATAHEQRIFVGIDVSKDKLDVHIHPSGETYEFANEASGIEELVARGEGEVIPVLRLVFFALCRRKASRY
jgi:transposase